ncbi:MAG: 50S ribosomal protein L18 [Candidatus Saccharimonadales bacterium]
MNRLLVKTQHNNLRRARTRAVISGTSQRPRLSVHVSNQHVIAQIIDDTRHQTLCYVTTAGQKSLAGNKTAKAEWVGAEIARRAKAAKITKVVYDRGGKLYHGRVAALAEAARKTGLEF